MLEQRGSDVRNVRAVTHGALGDLSPLFARRLLAVLPEFTETEDFRTLAGVDPAELLRRGAMPRRPQRH